jgi:hypothetical protein
MEIPGDFSQYSLCQTIEGSTIDHRFGTWPIEEVVQMKRTGRKPRAHWFLAGVICSVFWLLPQVHGRELNILWPAIEPASLTPRTESALEVYELRRGNIEVPRQLKELCKQAEVGDVLQLSFFNTPSAKSTTAPTRMVTVVAVEQSPLNLVSLRGRLEGQQMESFVLTVAEDGFIVSCQDLEAGILFRAHGNALTGIGSVTEVDLSKIPPRKCGACGSPAHEEENHE